MIRLLLASDDPTEEVPHRRGDLRGVRLQREVPGVEEAHDRVRDVARERLGPLRQEERVVLAPHRQQGRLVAAEILLEGRVERDVALGVPEQVELQLGRAGPAQVEVVGWARVSSAACSSTTATAFPVPPTSDGLHVRGYGCFQLF